MLSIILNGAHSKTATEFLYLETASIKIFYIIAARRLSYLQSILQRDENELVSKYYKAQVVESYQGDFVKLVEEDKKLIKLPISDYDIKNMSVNNFKGLVKEHTFNACWEHLLKLKSKHKKIMNIKYDKNRFNHT